MAVRLTTLGNQLSALAEVKSSPGQWVTALRATAMTTVTVLAVWAVLGKELALLSITGSFIGNTAINRPWRARLHILFWMDLAYLVGCGVTVLIGENPVLLTLSLTVIAMTSVLVYNALMADPPGPMFLIIGPAIASYLPSIGVARATVLAVCALSCLVASVMTLLLHPRTKKSPEALAVERAKDAVDALTEASKNPETDALELAHLRDSSYAEVLAASMTLEEAVGRNPRGQQWLSLLVQLRRQHFRVIGEVAARWLPNAVVEVEAAAQRRYLGAPPVDYQLRWGFSPRSLPWLAARRIGIAIALVCAVSYGLKLHHPFWAVMTTALVMSLGRDRLSLTHRGLHRMVGTLAGIVAFVGLHALGMSLNVLIVVCLALVFMVQWTAPLNYAIAAFFVTPMALLITTSSAPGRELSGVVGERVIDTLIGVGVSIAVTWATARRTPIALARRQFRRVLRVTADLLELLAAEQHNSEAGLRVRRDLAYEQLQAAHILRIAQEDLPVTLGSWSQVEVAVNQLVYTSLVACWIRRPNEQLDLADMAASLRSLIRELPPVSTRLVDADELVAGIDKVLWAGSSAITLPAVEETDETSRSDAD